MWVFPVEKKYKCVLINIKRSKLARLNEPMLIIKKLHHTIKQVSPITYFISYNY